jgi:hypothetical protein
MALESLADALAALEQSGTNTAGSGGQGNPPPTPYNSKLASNVTLGNPNTTNHSLGTGLFNGYNTYDELTSEAISKRKFNINNLGKNDRLGEGDFTLGTLFKHNHRGAPQRGLIDTGKKDYLGNAITINTGRAGIGSLANLDIKGYSSFARTGLLGPVAEGIFRIATLGLAGGISDAIGDFGKEPYIVRNIPKSGNGIYGGSRDTIPFRAALDDVSRLAQFYSSFAGLGFIAKENFTNINISAKAGGVSGLIESKVGSIMAPPVPLPLTGFLSLLGVPQKVQGAGLGTIRKPFKIRYSDRASIGLPYGIQGDATLGIKKVIEKTKVPQDLRPIFKIPLEKLREAAIAKLESVAQVPQLKRTPFLDIGKTPDPRSTYSKDKVNKTTTTSDDKDFDNGDFYVKIKDLREGGSFVYFRGFVTGITENVSPSFTPTNYIGRSEPVYMYERAERDISFNLRVYPNNGSEFEIMYEKIEYLTSLAYPKYLPEMTTNALGIEVANNSLVRMQPPFTELYMAHIGTRKQGQFGFIKSLSYTVPGEGDWDALRALPRLFDIAISYQILNKKPPQMGNKFYGRGR